MTLPMDLENVAWYGRGPGESYVDSKQAALVGRYASTVADLYTPYVYPQENGNREDVRWLALTNERGVGLYAQGLPLLNFSAHYFTTRDLADAKHTNKLEIRDQITLSLDHRQCGLGSGRLRPRHLGAPPHPAGAVPLLDPPAGVFDGPGAAGRVVWLGPQRLRLG